MPPVLIPALALFVTGALVLSPWHGLALAILGAATAHPPPKSRVPNLEAWAVGLGTGAFLAFAWRPSVSFWQWNGAQNDPPFLVTLDTRGLIVSVALCMGAYLLGVASRNPGTRAKRNEWHSHSALVDALMDSDVFPRSRDGLRPRLGQNGKITRDEYGESLTVRLPPGISIDQVQGKRARLASALGVPTDALEITQPDDAPANVVNFWVGKTRPRGKVGSGQPARLEGVWEEGVDLGASRRGERIRARTMGTHTLIVGATESGKTRLARIIVAKACLNPHVVLWAIDGKGEAADWQALKGVCEIFSGEVSNEQPHLTIAAIKAAIEHGRKAQRESRETGRVISSPGLLLIEEWATVRSNIQTVMGQTGLEEADKLMATVLAQSRSGGIHVVLITQKPTADSFPTLQRANVVQRIVMRTTQASDTNTALGGMPIHARPKYRGHALILDAEHGEREIYVDDLTDEAWQAACERGQALRGPQVAPPALAPLAPPRGADPAPLLLAVQGVLSEASSGYLTPTALWDALPEELRGGSAAALGKRLSALGVSSRTANELPNKPRVYELATVSAAVSAAV